MKTVHIVVSGLVQGVGFRYFCDERAKKMGLRGWVRNNEDDTLEIKVQGRPLDIQRFISLCRNGPTTARVDDFFIEELEEKEKMEKFEILR